MKKRRVLIILLILIVLVISIGAYYYFTSSNKNDVNFTTVKRGTISKTIDETGEICSKKINTFYSDNSKKIDILNVSIGDEVKQGDVLLVYDNNYDLEIQRQNKKLDALTAKYSEEIRGVDFEQISNTKLSINSLEANLELAKSNYDKSKALYEQNVISKSEYEKKENEVKQLENKLDIEKNNYDLLIKGVSNNIKEQYEAQIDEAVLGIQLLENKKEDNYIKASFDGIVTELNVNEKSMTQYGKPVIEIQDHKDLCINADLLVDDAAMIDEGMDVIVDDADEKPRLDVLTLNVDKIYPKAFSKISELGIEQKRVRVEIGIPEYFKGLRIGTRLDVDIVVDKKSDVLLIDKEGIYQKEGKNYVMVLEGDNEKEVEVVTGIEEDEMIEIISGLKENDKIVIE